LPLKEKKPIIEWSDKKATALDDILLLLSIFTLRDVFATSEPIEKGSAAVTADSREYFFGLRTAIKYEKGEDECGDQCDIGFQKGVERCTVRCGQPNGKGNMERGVSCPYFDQPAKGKSLKHRSLHAGRYGKSFSHFITKPGFLMNR